MSDRSGPNAHPSSEAEARGLERLIQFSDAVVAIAITLLVLPLLNLADHKGTMNDMLSEGGSEIMMFFISFVVVASFWLTHREVFEGVSGCSGRLVWVNMFWLVTIVFLPFPTEVLGVHGPDGAGVRAFYIGSLLACSIAQMLLSIVIIRSPLLWRNGVRPQLSMNAATVSVALFVVIFVVATFVPGVGLYALLGLFLLHPIARWLDARTSDGGGATA